MKPFLNPLLRLTALVLTAASFQAATPVMAQPVANSRSGLVLFPMPPDRLRVEENGSTRLRSLGTDSYDIFIRAPFDVTGSAADAVERHARWLAAFYRVQPVGAPTTIPHPGGLDVSARSFVIGSADGRTSFTVVAAVKGGAKAAIVEFLAPQPQPVQAVQKMLVFLQGCELAHMQLAAAGPPPLTVYDLESTLDLLEMLLDLRLSPAQREFVRADLLTDWRRGDAETVAQVRQFVELRDQLGRLSAARVNMVRRQVEQQLTAALRQETSPVAAMLVRAYDAAHPAIAAGLPALTRQQADAALDLFYFLAGQLEGVTASPSAGVRATWAATLAASWPTLPLEMRQAIVGMPATWALTQAVWPELTVAMRQQVAATYATFDVVQVIRADFVAARNQFRANVPVYRPAPSSVAAAPAPAANVDVSEQMARMNRNYQVTQSMLNSGFNSTMTQMANIGNWSGTRYTVR